MRYYLVMRYKDGTISQWVDGHVLNMLKAQERPLIYGFKIIKYKSESY